MSNKNATEGWPDYRDGPWTAEPDRVEFEHKGFPCLMTRGPTGHWCGYVAVAPGHPWHKKTGSKLRIRVHGGITYTRECHGHVCHVPKPGEPDNVWWVGFDCAHWGDRRPEDSRQGSAMEQLLGDGWCFMREAHAYRDVAYVKAECESLAGQAHRSLTAARHRVSKKQP